MVGNELGRWVGIIVGDRLGRWLGIMVGDRLGRPLGNIDGFIVTEGLILGKAVLHTTWLGFVSSTSMIFKVSSANPASKKICFIIPEPAISFITIIKSKLNVLSCAPCNIIPASISILTK